MKLNSEQSNIIYFPPNESDYFDLKTKFLKKNLPSQYDNALGKNTCRFPSGFKSFKQEVDEGKSSLDLEKIKLLINKSPDEENSVESFEKFLYDLDNPNKISDNEKVTVVDPSSEEGGNTIEVLYNDLVKLLCIYKQYFRSKYKTGPTSDQTAVFKDFEQRLYNQNSNINDVEGFKISGTNTDNLSSVNDLNVVTNSTGSNLPVTDTQTSAKDLNIVTNSSAGLDLSRSESSLTKENIDEIVNKVIEGLKESMCKKNTSEGGKRVKTRVRKKKYKNVTNVRKKRKDKKSYKKKVKITKKKS